MIVKQGHIASPYSMKNKRRQKAKGEGSSKGRLPEEKAMGNEREANQEIIHRMKTKLYTHTHKKKKIKKQKRRDREKKVLTSVNYE